MSSPLIIHWFRRDLRLADNPALSAAVTRCRAIEGARLLLVYVHDDETPGDWRWGGAQRWWLHHSLNALAGDIGKAGNRLALLNGRAETVFTALAKSQPVKAVFWNRCYEPFNIQRDKRIKQLLHDRGIEAASHNGSLLHEPWTLQTGAGQPYKVFTPYWRTLQQKGGIEAPLPACRDLPPSPVGIDTGNSLSQWHLLPSRPDWAGGLRDSWQPGETSAADRLVRFLEHSLTGYKARRDQPGIDGTSRLSPHLHWGEISPRQIWFATLHHEVRESSEGTGEPFLREVGWREFCYNLLYHWPELPTQPLNDKFSAFPWREDADALAAWQRGQTGFPIIDAGMRQLWQTGWMHNRVRMIVGSFLVKNLLLPWQAGQRWFWDTLVDGDLANNAAGWQWIAGCGADAAPYFRIFNPILQSKKFDPDGTYIRRFVPELARVPGRYIHTPWEAASDTLRSVGVRLGENYPRPIIDLGASRQRALAAFESLGRTDTDVRN